MHAVSSRQDDDGLANPGALRSRKAMRGGHPNADGIARLVLSCLFTLALLRLPAAAANLRLPTLGDSVMRAHSRTAFARLGRTLGLVAMLGFASIGFAQTL